MGEVTGWRTAARWAGILVRVLIGLVLFGVSLDTSSDQATRIVSAIYLSVGSIYFLLAHRLRKTP